MTQSQVQKLKIGDRVRDADNGSDGSVIDVSINAVKIHWDDGGFAIVFHNETAGWLERV